MAPAKSRVEPVPGEEVRLGSADSKVHSETAGSTDHVHDGNEGSTTERTGTASGESEDEGEKCSYFTAADADKQIDMLGDRVCEPLQKLAAKEAYVAMNSWIPGGEEKSRAKTQHMVEDMETWISRMAYIDAERKAAAADAVEFYSQMDAERETARTFNGLAFSKAIRDARLMRWNKNVADGLKSEGRLELVEAAVKRYEPPRISEDPNIREMVEERWETTVELEKAKKRGLIKEGWLYTVALTGYAPAEATVVAAGKGQRFWCSLIESSGLMWAKEKKGALCGMMSWEMVARVELAKFFPGTFVVEGVEQSVPKSEWSTGQSSKIARRLLFRGEDEAESKEWFQCVHRVFETFKIYKGGDDLKIVAEEWCEPGTTEVFKVPQIDGVKFESIHDRDRPMRGIIWFVKQGDKVVAGDIIATIERLKGQQPAEIPAPRSGLVLELFVQRTDPRSGDKYTRIADNLIKIQSEAVWHKKYTYVKREALSPHTAFAGSVTGMTSVPGTGLGRRTTGRPDTLTSRPMSASKEGTDTAARQGRWGTDSHSETWVLHDASMFEGKSEGGRDRSATAMRSSTSRGVRTPAQRLPSLYANMVLQCEGEDANGFWQTTKKYSQTLQSQIRTDSPSARHNHTVQTIQSRYSDKAIAAAASILESSMTCK